VALLRRGNIAGDDTFFSYTNHTTTLTPREDSELCYLERHVFEKILSDNPAIKSKLFNYCKKYRKAFFIDNSERHARRTYERHPVYLKGEACQVDLEEKPVEKPSGTTIVDLSAGGLSFSQRNLKPEKAVQIHNRWVRITGYYGEDPDEKYFTRVGRVVAVGILPFGECTVHIQFKKPLAEEFVSRIVKQTEKKD
jgi:CRP-like cAMP-binding protein